MNIEQRKRELLERIESALESGGPFILCDPEEKRAGHLNIIVRKNRQKKRILTCFSDLSKI